MPTYYATGLNPLGLDSCDGSEELFASNTISLDNDGDGFTDSADSDCAPEICDDGIDNDADGTTDCADSDCDGQTGPIGEICQFGEELSCYDTFDNDADGATDCADVDCDGVTDGACNTGLPGICSAGTLTCTGGAEQCVQDNQPVTEDVASGNCGDELDNDCDGLTDTDPECVVVGKEVNCFDGIDNDDDGATDCVDTDCYNAVGGPQTICGVGACAGNTGNLTCDMMGNQIDTCDPFAGAAPDDSVCNNIDDDCDGPIDEDYMITETNCGVGACASTGDLTCVNGNEEDSCMPGTPTPEICDDPGMVDEDCDGQPNSSDPDCGGAVMPPPVRQNIGFFDGDFTNLAADDCRFCHDLGNGPVDGVCSVSGTACSVDPDDPQSTCPNGETCLPILAKNRHHLLVDSMINQNTSLLFPADTMPPPNWTGDADNDGINDTNYACENCHPDDPDTPIIEFPITGNCLVCHRFDSPHHSENVELAQEKRCLECHGDIVNLAPDACTEGGAIGCTSDADCPGPNNFCGDGHVIPTYDPSLVTPWPSGKPNAGLPLNSRNDGAGQCIYCHNDDGLMPPEIVTNELTHHNTSLESQGKCTWCHPTDNGPNGDAFDIRVCEECHGFASLHNVQDDSTATGLVDTDGDGVVDTENQGIIIPGAEDPYFGHIGNQDDCWGCHGFASASAPGAGEISPSISDISASVMIAGTDATVTVTGAAFTNLLGTSEVLSNVVLTAKDGSETVLAPDAITTNQIVVTIPGTTPVGTYAVRAVKGSVRSNPVALFVTPGVEITDVRCRGNKKRGYTLTISGAGFGDAPPAGSGDYLNVVLNGIVLDSTITWEDTEITAGVSRCPSTSLVNVNALFGSDTAQARTGKIKKPKK
jgi:hypothetical protein